MNFEFDYNTDTEQITIVYDGSCVITATFDGDKTHFKGFDKVDDEEVIKILKSLCKDVFTALG
jgi:hypothetical protein